ncbi:MAG: cell division protein FtsQ/DivIB [Acidimicrobiia bacterium]
MIDPRIAERRKTVLESGARKGVRRALILLVGVASLAGLVWLLQSPLLSVNEITIAGSDREDVLQAVAAAGLEAGTPLVLVRTDEIVDALEALPWVRVASAERMFPDQVEVRVEERIPAGWIWNAGSYLLVDDQGVVLEEAAAADPEGPVLQFPIERLQPGEAYSDQMVLGAIEFVAAGGGEVPGLELWQEGDEMWASVDGHRIRLGRPVDMAAKAAALNAVLSDDVPAASLINLIAPSRPAVTEVNQPSS